MSFTYHAMEKNGCWKCSCSGLWQLHVSSECKALTIGTIEFFWLGEGSGDMVCRYG